MNLLFLMMAMNFSQVSYFTFSAYLDIGPLKYFVFVLVLILYVLIIGCNVLLIVVICVNRTLHEPMYMFLCSLLVNELYGSTGLFPSLLIQLLSDVHTISAPLCFLQIVCIYMYANVEFYNLAAMSYDRYLAICHPLQYKTLMSLNMIVRLIVLSWCLPLFYVIILTSLSASSQLCGNIIDRLFCNNYYVVKLACSNTTASNVYGLVYTFTVPIGLAVLIVYTYMRILRVCCSGSGQTRQKAVSTCMPHLVSLLNFSFGCFFEVSQGRFDMSYVPHILRIILSVYFITCQPLLNPVLYGVQLRKIRMSCKTLFFRKKNLAP
ncbi:olfactory receptor 10A6-like [Nothobranchius furzeri]|uniref:Olfactory receptor n=1 Tax=Nothobranchius furzeri TaxID=105023 RepID=A0A9D2XB67_NOTFU|nr:olfactory receptor 10A6-like [Nothobranchius furzeri]KAF7199154.1 olfactory receptor 10A6-like [Nothobranchius furzeri]